VNKNRIPNPTFLQSEYVGDYDATSEARKLEEFGLVEYACHMGMTGTKRTATPSPHIMKAFRGSGRTYGDALVMLEEYFGATIAREFDEFVFGDGEIAEGIRVVVTKFLSPNGYFGRIHYATRKDMIDARENQAWILKVPTRKAEAPVAVLSH
jgi:hypothetical protein